MRPRRDYVVVLGDPKTGGVSTVIHWSSPHEDSGLVIADTPDMRTAIVIAEIYCRESGTPLQQPGPYLISGEAV